MMFALTALQTETEASSRAQTETCSAMYRRKMPAYMTYGYAEVTAYARHMAHYSSRSYATKISLTHSLQLH